MRGPHYVSGEAIWGSGFVSLVIIVVMKLCNAGKKKEDSLTNIGTKTRSVCQIMAPHIGKWLDVGTGSTLT